MFKIGVINLLTFSDIICHASQKFILMSFFYSKIEEQILNVNAERVAAPYPYHSLSQVMSKDTVNVYVFKLYLLICFIYWCNHIIF